MKHLNWWTAIFLLLISHSYAATLNEGKAQESDLKADAKELIKAAASSAEYSASLANDYQAEKQQDNVASSSSVSAVESNNNYNAATENQQQYSQPLSYSQPGTPVQPIHSYSQPLNYGPQALSYAAESQQVSSQYGSADAGNQYGSLKDVPMPDIPSASASSQYYPQYPAHQQYNPHLVLQQQASAPVSDYQVNNAQAQQYDSNQATYVQPIQHQNVYLHHQHHVSIPGSSYSEQSYVVDGNGDKNAYAQANSYSQPLPSEYSQEYSNNAQPAIVSNNVPAKPKKTVILAIPVKLVAKNKYATNQNNGGYSGSQEVPQPHYSTNVVPAAASLPVTHSIEKNNYNNNEQSFNEKPLYADKPAYTDKVEEYQPKVNHNLNNNLNNNGYNGEYEQENGDHYARNPDHGRYNSGPVYNGEHGPHKQSGPIYNPGREVKPLSNYMQGRPKKQSSYGPAEIYSSGGNAEYSSGPAHTVEEISVGPEHGGYSVGELENNHLPVLPHHSIPHKHHKINEVYEPVDHIPPYIPSDFPSLSSSIGGGIGGIGSYPNPMELIYSSPYKLSGPPHHGYGKPSYRPSLLGSASSQSQTTASSSSSNYGQFLSSLLSAYSLGSLKPNKPSSSSKGSGLAGYLNNLPGFDLLKGYSALSPSSYTSSLLTSASGLNKYYLPNPNAKPAAQAAPSKQNLNYLGWPAELAQPAKPKPTGLLASSSNIVSSIDELFKSSLTSSTSKFKRPYSDATRAITNLYKKFLN